MLARARNELELLAAKKRGIAGASLPAARQQQRNKMKEVVTAAAASITDGGEGSGASGDSHPEEYRCRPSRLQEEEGILGGTEKTEEGTSKPSLPPPATSKEREVAGMVLTRDEEESRLPTLERRHSAPVVAHSASNPRGGEAITSQTERPRPGEEVNVSSMPAWSCSLCTLLNEPLDPHCIMCGTLREMKEGGLVTNDTSTSNIKKGPTKATHEEEQQRPGKHTDEGRDTMQAELEEMRAKNEKLMALLMKMKEEANRAKEEKERYASYEALMAALTAGIINDDHLETVESELEARLALVRQLRRDRVRARILALEREEREMRATTLCIICTDSPRYHVLLVLALQHF